MTQTRSSKDAAAGEKHKLDESTSSPHAKVQKTDKAEDKKQLTLHESFNGQVTDLIPAAPKVIAIPCPADFPFLSRNNMKRESKQETEQESEPKLESKTDGGDGVHPDGESKMQDDKTGNQAKKTKEHTQDKDSAIEPHGRNGSAPSTILEKGIIYFFFRGRVGIDHPEKVSDIARSYMILRPIPTDAKLGDGPIGDVGNARLIAIPKKVLPQSGRDRWIAFVERSSTSFDQLQAAFLDANDYETKTAGTRHTPAATPIGEGVYAITTTGRESHLAYMLTLPEKLGEVQSEMGLKERGSWILSTRNPQYPAPQGTALPESPDFSKEVSQVRSFIYVIPQTHPKLSSDRAADTDLHISQILDEFRSLRWMGTLPKHLIPNAQFLLVGESSGLEKAMQPDEKDEKATDKEEPMEEMEKLEDEDTARMQHLGEDATAAIFADLEAHAENYPKLQTIF